MSRTEQRVQRLQEAHAKLVAKVTADPDNPKAEAWKAKCLEYEASLESISRFGKEVHVENAGVEIDVPVSGFKVEAV